MRKEASIVTIPELQHCPVKFNSAGAKEEIAFGSKMYRLSSSLLPDASPKMTKFIGITQSLLHSMLIIASRQQATYPANWPRWRQYKDVSIDQYGPMAWGADPRAALNFVTDISFEDCKGRGSGSMVDPAETVDVLAVRLADPEPQSASRQK
ncbi:predicted protein [Histoplasma capsulatum var. duboisii H88]|uniref:Predicted protein n=2 Tax=Ajellomyces capsulatus TaxID=5037 RepID=F0UFJ4_AJEC8|nr:predicted protein [Histoplasma capsulatum H143]EGC44154.1 predicted protein [Histoplasma capsulatum var. duboisii H88]